MEVCEGAEVVTRDQFKRYLKSNEFKAKVFKQSRRFYSTEFNDGLRTACEALIIPLSTLCVLEYDSKSEEVQYGPSNRALLKTRPPALQGSLARFTAEFDQGNSQASANPSILKAANALIDPPPIADVLVNLIIRLPKLPLLLLELSLTGQ